MPNNDWLTGYLQKKSKENPLEGLNSIFGIPKEIVDTASNYYSGLPGALDPNKKPIPLEDLATEALFPGSTTEKNTGPNMSASALNAILGAAGDPASYYGGGKGPIPMAGVLNEEGENVAFHGTPHNFDKFDSSKIGTGEGNQSYGHGMYFADDPGVAESYRKRLSGDQLGSRNAGNLVGAKLPPPDKFLDYDATLKDLPPHIADVLPETDMARRYEDNYTKAMHDVEASLPYIKNVMGDWTKPIEDALDKFKSGSIPPNRDSPMQALWQEEGDTTPTRYEGEVSPIKENLDRFANIKAIASNDAPIGKLTGLRDLGQNLWNAYAGPTPDMPISSIDLGPEGVQRLSDKGIAGVKYRDANSRDIGSGPVKHNYVVFNPERDAEIKGKLPSPTKDEVSTFLQNVMKIRPY